MSSPSPSRRKAVVIELKRGGPLRVGRGAGVQLRNAERLVREVMLADGVLAPDAPYDRVTGDGDRVVDLLAKQWRLRA